jgi:hypothetical protein
MDSSLDFPQAQLGNIFVLDTKCCMFKSCHSYLFFVFFVRSSKEIGGMYSLSSIIIVIDLAQSYTNSATLIMDPREYS